jgi:hypothetical protein
MRFAVGLKLKGKPEHVIVDAEDSLIAALNSGCSGERVRRSSPTAWRRIRLAHPTLVSGPVF